jgi:Alw26I/Eco31I/Esp3I family type II restriction m6 adenine DNA methyltransferase
MESKQAQEFIKEVLNSRFDHEKFEYFVRNLLNEYEPKENNYSGNLIPEAYRQHIAHYRRIGKYTDPEGELLDVLIVHTRSVRKLDHARSALRNFVVHHLKNFGKYYALVAFYSKEDEGEDWRLSFVKIDFEQERTESGRIKIKEDIVPAKRFSYLVGIHEDAYTAQKQLLPLLENDHSNPLIAKEKDGDGSVEGAFSIEKVTDEFYEQYRDLYLKLYTDKNISKELISKGVDPSRFIKKLLGQIVFLYFIQKKGWLGVSIRDKMGQGSKRFLQDQYEKANKSNKNYFNDFLRHLFYSALAKEHNDQGIKNYFAKLECKIPFLNGGLFEAEYDWENSSITIPNELFRNNEKNKAGDRGNGILDVFDRFNFTIKEDEPLEKEVAVDPEMLGKVFENMLDISERKGKGAFYTPREIVHYMCQESLIHYLDNEMNDYIESYQPIDTEQVSFLKNTDKRGDVKIEFEKKGDIRIQKEELEQFIRHGHFVLEHETTATEKGNKTSSYKHRLPESIRKNSQLLDEVLADIKICDPAIGSGAFAVGLLQEIVTSRLVLNSYLQRGDHTSYNLKKNAIQNSIYGVDIDESAIDIARLRLWLSLIVEEEEFDSIEALPNLDYKIVCGNSLIGMPDTAMRNLEIDSDLEKLKRKFFNETSEKKKNQFRQQINSKIRELLDSAEEFAGFAIDFDFKLYFSEVWHHKSGFDIVIGNPPYDVYEGKKVDEIPTIKKIPLYDIAKTGKLNAYKLFLAKSSTLIKKKGLFNQIFQNSFLGDNSAKLLRKHFLTEQKIIRIDSFPERDDLDKRVFRSAKMSVCIMFSENIKLDNYAFPMEIWEEKWMANSQTVAFSNQELIKYDPDSYVIPSISNLEKPVLDKLSKRRRFGSVSKCYQGEINLSTNKSIISETKSDNTKPLLKGAGIQKWHLPSKMSQGKDEFLVFEEYLKKNKGPKSKHYKFQRIVMQGITGVDEKHRIKASLLNKDVFCGHSVNYISLENIEINRAYYWIAVLNSEVSNWFFKKFSTNSGKNEQ